MASATATGTSAAEYKLPCDCRLDWIQATLYGQVTAATAGNTVAYSYLTYTPAIPPSTTTQREDVIYQQKIAHYRHAITDPVPALFAEEFCGNLGIIVEARRPIYLVVYNAAYQTAYAEIILGLTRLQ